MQDAFRSLGEEWAKQGSFIKVIQGRYDLMKYVYLLESVICPGKRYIGITDDFASRLKEHNAGKSPHTSRFKPWKTVVAIKFSDDQKANAFEKYLKSGSGHAFAKRHFW